MSPLICANQGTLRKTNSISPFHPQLVKDNLSASVTKRLIESADFKFRILVVTYFSD